MICRVITFGVNGILNWEIRIHSSRKILRISQWHTFRSDAHIVPKSKWDNLKTYHAQFQVHLICYWAFDSILIEIIIWIARNTRWVIRRIWASGVLGIKNNSPTSMCWWQSRYYVANHVDWWPTMMKQLTTWRLGITFMYSTLLTISYFTHEAVFQ